MIKAISETTGWRILAPAQPIPEDLRDWFGEQTLAQLTLEAVCRVNLGSRTGSQGADLLALICYSYARGMLGSRQIERAARHDPTLQLLCGNACPEWNSLRRFRRQHRNCLLRTLHHLLASAYELRPERLAPQEPRRHEIAPATNSQIACWLVALREAAARIERAVHADSMDLDE